MQLTRATQLRTLKLRNRTVLRDVRNEAKQKDRKEVKQKDRKEVKKEARKKVRKEASHTCPACQEKFATSETLPKRPCGHRWCKECLLRLVEHSLTDDMYFPPRCCGRPFPLMLLNIIGPDLMSRYKEKKRERDDSSPNYCAYPLCSTYIPPENFRGNTGTCKACGKKTCALCKSKSHKLPCVEGLVWKTIRKKRWRQCKRCHNVIERTGGCKHMT